MKTPNCEHWTTTDLFSYAIGNSLISPEDDFEDWMNNRTDLYRIVQDHLDSLS